MLIFHSLLSLLSLFSFFCIIGLGISSQKFIHKTPELIPLFGYIFLIGISYVISANFKLSGSDATAITCLLLLFLTLIRIKNISSALLEVGKGAISKNFFIICIPILTILLPAIITGFDKFYGYINFDFFFNNQDSVFLQTHNVVQYQIDEANIVPLTWSANYSGRIAITLIGAFFSKWFGIYSLGFNSLLLNTIVLLFTLSMSVFCKEVLKLRGVKLCLAIFFSLLSAPYVQSYCYYVLGQISALPIFIVFCIYLNRFLNKEFSNESDTKNEIIILAVLLNVLFVVYAILSMFALCLGVLSYLIFHRFNLRIAKIKTCLKIVFLTLIIFCLARIIVIPDTFNILHSWYSLSHQVAAGTHKKEFMVFSDYLTSDFLALLFGLANYPISSSAFAFFIKSPMILNYVICGIGLIALLGTLFVLSSISKRLRSTDASSSILTSLFCIYIVLSFYFFYSLSGYGIYKLQTWFFPILITIYVYCLMDKKSGVLLKILCAALLVLNFTASMNYLADFFVKPVHQHFVNSKINPANNDILDIVAQIKKSKIQAISLGLNDGVEAAWFGDLLRTVKIDRTFHNTQPLTEKDLSTPVCSNQSIGHWPSNSILVLPNPKSEASDITSEFTGDKLYTNSTFLLADSNKIKTLVYFGTGAYPVNTVETVNKSFPTKFRWIEKGAEIMIYSNTDRTVQLSIEVTPGFVDNHGKPRTFTITSLSGNQTYTVNAKTTLIFNNLKLKKGINCVSIESPDNVSRLKQYGALIRPEIPMDPRMINFAISYAGIK